MGRRHAASRELRRNEDSSTNRALPAKESGCSAKILNCIKFPVRENHLRCPANPIHQHRDTGGLMIELEIQTLSERREGLLIDVGRSVLESGFTLQRQRLTQDANGMLLTIVVRGPARRQRALEAALDAHERIISFEISAFVEGETKPHFAAARRMAWPTAVPVPAALTAATPVVATAVIDEPVVPDPVVTPAAAAEPLPPEADFMAELLSVSLPAAVPPPAPAPVAEAEVAFVEMIPLGPDIEAVEKVLPGLTRDYPQILPWLQTLEHAVAEASRESSLALVGQRTGAWLFERDHAAGAGLDLHQAIERIGVPALAALVEIEQQGGQLHIRNSPLCTEDGHSGCRFFGGYLEGLLGPALLSESLSIFAVCCRSCGADECVLAVSD